MAHIHEHKDSINRYVYNSLKSISTGQCDHITVLLSRRVRVLLDSPVFATFSSDGTTKLWDVQKLEGRNLINKAKLSYTQLGPGSSSSSLLIDEYNGQCFHSPDSTVTLCNAHTHIHSPKISCIRLV